MGGAPYIAWPKATRPVMLVWQPVLRPTACCFCVARLPAQSGGLCIATAPNCSPKPEYSHGSVSSERGVSLSACLSALSRSCSALHSPPSRALSTMFWSNCWPPSHAPPSPALRPLPVHMFGRCWACGSGRCGASQAPIAQGHWLAGHAAGVLQRWGKGRRGWIAGSLRLGLEG